jgi:WD40 repeat protein
MIALRTDEGIDLYDYPTLEKLRTLKQTAPRKSTSFLTVLATLAFSPDGKTLAAAAEKGNVILWDLSTGNQLKTFSGLEREITSLAFWPDGQFLYATGEDASLMIWDAVSGSVLNRAAQKGRGISIAATGGLYLSFADTNGKMTLNGPNGEIALPIKGAVNHAAVSPNGKMVVVAGDSTLTIWNISRREQQAALVGPACCVAFSPDSQMVLTGGKSERVVHLWDATTGRRLFSLNQPAAIQQVTFTPDGSTLLVGLINKTVQIFTLNDPNRPTITPPPTATPRPTFTRTVTAPAIQGTPIALPVTALNATNVNQMAELTRWHKAQGLFLGFIANGQALLDIGENGIDIRNTIDGKVLSSFTFQNTQSGLQYSALSPDGKLLATTADSKTSVWRLTNPATRQTVTTIEKCFALAFSPDSQTLLCDRGDNILTLVNLATGQPQRTFSGQIKNVAASTFTSDGKTLAAAGNDGNIILWEAATGKVLRTLTGFSGWITGFQFSPDGQTLAYTTKDGLVLLNTTSGALFNLPNVQKLAFSPDGQLLAVTTPDGITLWKVANNQSLYTIAMVPQEALAFSPDGTLLASIQRTGDKLIRLWGIPSNQPRPTAKPATITPTRTPLATTTLPAPLAVDWFKKYGFQVTYPQPQIKAYPQGAGVALLHSVPHSHTDPCNLQTASTLRDLIDFDVRLEIVPANLEEAKRITHSGTGGTDNVTLGPLTGGTFESYGVEGCGQDVYLFPVASNKTLWIVRRWIAEFSPIMADYEEHLALPGVISPEEADKLFKQMMATFKLTP